MRWPGYPYTRSPGPRPCEGWMNFDFPAPYDHEVPRRIGEARRQLSPEGVVVLEAIIAETGDFSSGGIRCSRGKQCGARICSLLFTCSSTCWSPITSPCATAKTRPAACPFPRNPSTSASAMPRAARTPATTVKRPAPSPFCYALARILLPRWHTLMVGMVVSIDRNSEANTRGRH